MPYTSGSRKGVGVALHIARLQTWHVRVGLGVGALQPRMLIYSVQSHLPRVQWAASR